MTIYDPAAGSGGRHAKAMHRASTLQRTRNADVALAALTTGTNADVVIANDLAFLIGLVQAERRPPSQAPALVLLVPPPTTALRLELQSWFPRLLVDDAAMSMLPLDELVDVVTADDAGERFVVGTVDKKNRVVALVRGDFGVLVATLSSFAASGDGTKPRVDPSARALVERPHDSPNRSSNRGARGAISFDTSRSQLCPPSWAARRRRRRRRRARSTYARR